MDSLKNIIITNVKQPFTVHSPKGKDSKITNRKFYGLSFCISGQITYTMNGQSYISNHDCAVFLPKGGTYSLHGDREGDFPVINFDSSNLDLDTITILPLKNPQGFIAEYETIKAMFLFPENRLKIFSAFYELINKLYVEQLPQYDLLSPAIHYIKENIADAELSNAILARQMGISEVYLRKLFISRYGTTPKQYILNIRIGKAKQLLLDTPLTVTAISEECGFSSLYHFCRSFKNRTGLSPMEYAKNNKKYKL